MTSFKFVPLDRTEVIRGTTRDFARYIWSGAWRRSSAEAFLYVRGNINDPRASHYPFDSAGFAMLAELAEDLDIRDPEKLRRLFFIHESTEAPKVSRRATVSERATVVQKGRAVGVRVAPLKEPQTIAPETRNLERRRALRLYTTESSRRTARRRPAISGLETSWMLEQGRARAKPTTKSKASATRKSKASATTKSKARANAKTTVESREPGAAQQAETLHRTPHMDFSDEHPSPGTTFQAQVWLDQEAARAEEESEQVVVELPAGVDEILLHVWLVSSRHFEVGGGLVQELTLRRGDERSGPVPFEVKVGRRVKSGRNASLTAMFAYQGRPAGKVTRRVRIKLPRPAREARRPRRTRTEGEVRLGTSAGEPDLTVEVGAAPDSNSRHFWCRVTSRHLPDLADEPAQRWDLPQVARDIVVSYMDGFTEEGLSGNQRLARLSGAGVQLFGVAPENFQKAFWRMIDEKKPFETISIVSAEPFIPWELMIPRRHKDGREELHGPLGIEFAVGRWIDEAALPPRQLFEIKDSYVIAPAYTGQLVLRDAEPEAQQVKKLFGGTRIEPAVFDEIERRFTERGAALLHFACHGAVSTAVAQVIYLEDDERLQSVDLLGMPGAKAACSSRQPLVFLNACEVGRPAPALVGIGGFAKAFIDIGAHGVVAPLWSVVDEIAHNIATEFYARVTDDPSVPLAEALREIRAHAYASQGGEDSYAAYCFYGDPLATLQVA
jgi:hypothetical protein